MADGNVTLALIALGANLPADGRAPANTLEQAIARLTDHPDIAVAETSPWYRTEAVPAGSGPDFVNGAAIFKTQLSPQQMLTQLHEVERALGRTRTVRWEPRVCDLDLIAVGETILPDRPTALSWIELSAELAMKASPDRLILPHPRMQDRSFVLVPLRDIAPDWRHPLLGLTVKEMCDRLPPAELSGIQKL
ncbi:MAG: 2-amino-4-hydroxy-6-hydroxymethyldihydropteridine diphosphokinase [Pseudomonadota bacterium]